MNALALLAIAGLSLSGVTSEDEPLELELDEDLESDDDDNDDRDRRGSSGEWESFDDDDRSGLGRGEIWFKEVTWTDGSSSYGVRVGPEGAPMEWEEFYRTVGRPDYAEEFSNRVLAKRIMYWTQFAACLCPCGGMMCLASGPVAILFASISPIVSLVAGGGLLSAGIAVVLAASITNQVSLWAPKFFSDFPVEMGENYDLAAAYNDTRGGRPAPAADQAPEPSSEAPPDKLDDEAPDDLELSFRWPAAARTQVGMAY